MKYLYNYTNSIDYVEYYWNESVEFRNIKESLFARGEWDSEPDHIAFTHEETGFNCAIYRSPEQGYLTGFIELPRSHPWHSDKSPIQMQYSAPNKVLVSDGKYGGILHQIFRESGFGLVIHKTGFGFMGVDPVSWVYGFSYNELLDLNPCPPPKGSIQTRQMMSWLKKYILLKNVYIDVSTDKSHKVSFSSPVGGVSTQVWVPKTQMRTPDGKPLVNYSVADIEVTDWFFAKIRASLEESGVDVGAILKGSASQLPSNVQPLQAAIAASPRSAAFKFSSLADCHDFIKFFSKFYSDPGTLEKSLDEMISVHNIGMTKIMAINVPMNISNLLLNGINGLDEFKSDLIQTALEEYFKANP